MSDRRTLLLESGERPILWIIAGPNGSGKSTLYASTDIKDFGRTIWIINPDLLAARIALVEGLVGDTANLEAVKRIEAWLYASIRAHQTIGVETVLSTDKYRRLVIEAKRLKFEIRLIYVLLDSVEHNIDRVRLRVAEGGHSVPEGKIRDRHGRSLGQLPWFLDQADVAWMFDNSGASPRRIGQKLEGTVILDPAALPEVAAAVRQIAAEQPQAKT